MFKKQCCVTQKKPKKTGFKVLSNQITLKNYSCHFGENQFKRIFIIIHINPQQVMITSIP